MSPDERRAFRAKCKEQKLAASAAVLPLLDQLDEMERRVVTAEILARRLAGTAKAS